MRSSIVFSSRFAIPRAVVVATVRASYIGSFTGVNAGSFFCTFIIIITSSLPVAGNGSVATGFTLNVRSVGCIGSNFGVFGVLSWPIYPTLCAGNGRSIFSTAIIGAVRMVVAIVVVVIVTMVISIPTVVIIDDIVVAPTPVVAPAPIVPTVIVVTPAIVATAPVVPTIPSIPGSPATVSKNDYYAVASVPIGIVPGVVPWIPIGISP